MIPIVRRHKVEVTQGQSLANGPGHAARRLSVADPLRLAAPLVVDEDPPGTPIELDCDTHQNRRILQPAKNLRNDRI
ncbi:MAG: hypothetical protein QF786_13670, partial [Vicinamibacterales bacterium]|nr:hypothetical protein [Vicinamibacterales bacterium]